MKFRSLWISLACLACLTAKPEFSSAQDGYADQETEAYGRGAPSHVSPGRWLWAVSDNALLRDGAITAAVAQGDPQTVYIGGFGSVLVSRDGGQTFRTSLRFDDDNASDPIVSFSQDDPTLITQRAEAIREYLRENLEEQFDSGYVDSLLDEITDDDLLEANEVTDLEPLRNLTLDMDTDLRNAPIELPAAATVTNLSDFDSFALRFRLARSVVRDTAQAIDYAANAQGVRQIRAIGTAAYAVTPSTVYMTSDSGNAWKALLHSAEGESFLSIDVSPDYRAIIIGASRGFILSQDGGASWTRIGSDIRAAVYDVQLTASNDIWALTTRGIFTTAALGNLFAAQSVAVPEASNGGGDDIIDGEDEDESGNSPAAIANDPALSQWKHLAAPLRQGEIALRIRAGADGSILLLTNEALYKTQDFIHWQVIGADVLNDAYLRDIYVRDDANMSFIVLTDSQVLEYDNGWINQSKGLQRSRAATVVPLPNENRLALIASDNGIYFAYDAKRIEREQAYISLKEQWSGEPSYEETIQAAFRAHYIDEGASRNWRTRSRLAWLLPHVRAQYEHRQKRDDYYKNTETKKDTGAVVIEETFSYKRETYNYWQIWALWDLRIEKAFKDDFSAYRIDDYRLRQIDIANEVVAALDQRRSLQINRIIRQIESGAPTLLDEINSELAMQEIEALLHGLTGGFYLPALHGRR